VILVVFLSIVEPVNANPTNEPWEYEIGYEIASVAISNDGQYIVAGTSYPHASIYYFAHGKLLWKHDVTGGNVYGLDLSADGKYIAVAGPEVIFMSNDKQVLWEYHIPTTVRSVDMTPDAEYIAVGALNGVHLLSRDGKLLWHYESDPFKTRGFYVAITSDGRYIAAAALIEHDGGYVYLFSRDGNLLWKKKVSDSFVLSVDISDDGKYLAVGLDREWLLLNNRGDVLYSNNELGGRAIAISKDNKYIAVRDTRRVYIFDIKGSKVAGIELSFSEETGIGSPSKLMEISPDFKSLVIGIMSGVNKIKVYPTIFGELHVTSIPENATLYVNDKYLGEVPQTLTLFPGTYKIELRKAGYFPYTESVTISPGSNLSMNIELTPIAHLTVYSTPEGAYVYLNGTLIGTTPIENYQLAPGTYALQVSKEGYKDYKTTISVSGGETKIVNANLEILNGTLKVSSEPPGAEVYVNGSYKGTTPLVLDLYPDEYTVEIKKEGYNPYSEKVTVKPGQMTSITATLTLLNGVLTVSSSPLGADVYLNGTLIGTTPIEEYPLVPGTYELEIVKENYESQTIAVTVEPGESKNITVTLSPVKAILEVLSEPPGANVYLNGTLIGTTPIKDYSILPGTYELKVLKDGYQEYSTLITIGPKETKSFHVNLVESQTTTKTGAKSICGPALIVALLLISLMAKKILH